MSASITILIDNQTRSTGFTAQHGYALWVETDAGALLMDTGQDALVVQHAAMLGIPMTTIRWLMLTHGHYDHAGGVPAVLATGAHPKVAVQESIWDSRRAVESDGTSRAIGIPWQRQVLTGHGVQVKTSSRTRQLLPGVWSTGVIANCTGHQPIPRLQRLTPDGWVTDTFPDEQALVMVTEAGLVVCTGCCHAGLVNTLLAAQRATGIPQVYAIIGGLHLHASTPQEVTAVADALQPFCISHLWASHCTGEPAISLLHRRLGACVQLTSVGERREIPPLVHTVKR